MAACCMRSGVWGANRLRVVPIQRYIHTTIPILCYYTQDSWKAGIEDCGGWWLLGGCGRMQGSTSHVRVTGCISGCGFDLYRILISSLNILIMHKTLEKVGTGYRLSPPPGCPRMIYKLMIQCWWVRFMHACLLLSLWLQATILMQAS